MLIGTIENVESPGKDVEFHENNEEIPESV